MRRIVSILASALLCVAVVATTGGQAQTIRGQLSNFDAHQDNPGEEMTNLELDLRLITPDMVMGFYQGPNAWGIPPAIRDIGGTEVVWADFRQPILPGEMRHFGLELTPDAPAPCGVQAYWTQHRKIIEIPVPWQTWRPDAGILWDVIRLNPDFAEPVVVERQFAVLPLPVPLDELNWDNPDIPWVDVPGSSYLAPGDVVELPVEVGGLVEGAVLVRYTVALDRNPENVLSRLVNEAEFVAFSPVPEITGSLSNFDAHNDTGKPVHDLELDILNVDPGQILDWYRGPDAWGLHPIDGNPAIDPIPGGTEVHWVDEWNPIPDSNTRHFGLRLDPTTPEPLVRAFWTRVVKVRQIPVPWQWWQVPVPGAVVDVIQLSDTFDGPVTVLRESARVPTPVPLDDLVWDNPGITWTQEDAAYLEPGDQTFLTLSPGAGDGAVLVRYSVVPDALVLQPVVRFVNEALLDPAGTGQIIGSLSNFDVVNLSDEEMTNLELDFRGIQPTDIVGWYQGPTAWGLHPVTGAPLVQALPQTEVTWADFRDPLPFCQTRHFGLELRQDAPAPCGVQAYWTQHRKIVEIPVPWQTWRPEPDLVVDVIRLSPEFPGPVWVNREYLVLPVPLPLDGLNWDAPVGPWFDTPSEFLTPGDVLELPVSVNQYMEGAVLVRYSVARADIPDEVVTRFVNQAEFERIVSPLPSITGTLSNFDVHNNTGKPVHDLELDLVNVRPEQIWDWYRGPDAWGLDPVIRFTPDGLGTEVTWVSDHDPIPYCEIRHFGLRLDPGIPEPLVRAFWTREVKVRQIPVPWQFWMEPAGPFVRDVIQLSDTFVEPVTVVRQFALSDADVPLDDLNWDLSAHWQPYPSDVVTLEPGFQDDLDIPVDPTTTAAVLVRYEVQDATGATVTRFVNEARLWGLLEIRFDDAAALTWSSPLAAGAGVFDVVRGGLSSLATLGGVFDAACVADDLPASPFSDPADPPFGQGYYYLVREQAGSVHGTYDTTTDPALRENRDAQVGSDCP